MRLKAETRMKEGCMQVKHPSIVSAHARRGNGRIMDARFSSVTRRPGG